MTLLHNAFSWPGLPGVIAVLAAGWIGMYVITRRMLNCAVRSMAIEFEQRLNSLQAAQKVAADRAAAAPAVLGVEPRADTQRASATLVRVKVHGSGSAVPEASVIAAAVASILAGQGQPEARPARPLQSPHWIQQGRALLHSSHTPEARRTSFAPPVPAMVAPAAMTRRYTQEARRDAAAD